MINQNPNNNRSRRFLSDEIRRLIISHTENGCNVTTIARMMNLPRTTVSTVVSKFRNTGSIDRGNRGGDRRTKLSDEQKENVRTWVNEDATLTLEQLASKVQQEYSLSVSYSTINRCLNNFHYTLKTGVVVPERRNVEATIEERLSYAISFNDLLLTIDDSRFVFIDEVGFSVSLRTRRGRSLRGTSAYIPVGAIRSRNMSVIAAMSKYGMIKHKINERPVNGEDFRDFLRNLNADCVQKNITNPVFIMDNARIHHYSGVVELISELNLNVMYLPPYSPFLNPIENAFSK